MDNQNTPPTAGGNSVYHVLILVLMDNQNTATKQGADPRICLNPCSNG